jgi:hypothetical protein
MKNAWTPAQLLAVAFARKPNFAPGAEYEYCNTNYILLGLIIEKVEPQVVGPVNARPIVQAARPAAHVLASQQRERTPPNLIPTDTFTAVLRSHYLGSRRIRPQPRPRPAPGP